MRPITNIIFDLGRVLLDWSPEKVVASVSSQPDIQALLLDGIVHHQDWIDIDRGILPEDEAVQRWIARTGLSQALLRKLFDATDESLVPLTHTHTLLDELHQAGFDLYCLSNMSSRSFSHIRGKYDFWGKFKGIVVSAEVKLVKPDPAIYEHILSHYRLEPAATVFIDDRPENIAGARQLGIHGIVFESVQDCRRQLQALLFGHYVTNKLPPP